MWVVGVAAYLPVVAILVALVVLLQDARTTVDGPIAGRSRQLRDATLPLAEAATPVARAATADRPDALRVTRRTLALTAQVTPLARDLRASGAGRQLRLAGTLAADLTTKDAGVQLQKAGALSDELVSADAGTQLRRSGALASTLLGGDVGGVLDDVRGLAALPGNADLAGTARSLAETTDELNRGTRLQRLLVRLTQVVGQAQQLRFVPKATAAAESVTGRIEPLLEEGVRMQRELIVLTRDTNRHAANLDRKLGGDLPLP